MAAVFFDEMSEQSEVKALLVQKYFKAWTSVMFGAERQYPQADKRIAYVDLFSGPGRYKDGKMSTPLSVLQLAIADDEIRQRLVTIFNDKDVDNTNSLQEAIDELSGVETLSYSPEIWNTEVGKEITELMESTNMIPTLFFVDPWGYKGLSLRLINAVIKDFGCDCIFFFNYNRINMGLNNDAVLPHMQALFGDDKVEQMRQQMEAMSPSERELFIVNEIGEALRAMGNGRMRYVLPFTFKNVQGTRTSHHLIFITKHVRGYEIMKEIMASHSSTIEQGVASFDFLPSDNDRYPLLFELSRPLDKLGDILTQKYSGQTLTMQQVYEGHHVGTRYIKRNYKKAINQLEEQGRVQCDPQASRRQMRNRERTCGDGVLVTFP